MTNDEPFILIVIRDDKLRKSLLDAFQEHECPFYYEIVSSAEEVRNLLSQKSL